MSDPLSERERSDVTREVERAANAQSGEQPLSVHNMLIDTVTTIQQPRIHSKSCEYFYLFIYFRYVLFSNISKFEKLHASGRGGGIIIIITKLKCDHNNLSEDLLVYYYMLLYNLVPLFVDLFALVEFCNRILTYLFYMTEFFFFNFAYIHIC